MGSGGPLKTIENCARRSAPGAADSVRSTSSRSTRPSSATSSNRSWSSGLKVSAVKVSSTADPPDLALDSALARGGLAALAARGLLLSGRPALRGAAPGARGMRHLPTSTRRAGGIRDLRRALLRHALVLERLVLLLVLDVGFLVSWHGPVLAG